MRFNFPNIISLTRLFLSPIIFIFLIEETFLSVRIATAIYVIAALTDFIDGWLARKYKKETKTGKFLDPLADKFLTTSAFIAFVVMNIIPLWMVIVIIIRDFGTTFLRLQADSQKMQIETSLSAKIKTTLQMFFIAYILCLLMLKHSSYFEDNQVAIDSILYSDFTYFTMLILTIITVWTLIEYIYQNKLLFKRIFASEK